MTKTELLDRCARDREERILLGRVLDKGELTRARGIPAHTVFLSPGQRSAAEDMLNAWGRPRCLFWGGYEGAERTLCAFLPDWQEEEDLKNDPDGPIGGVEAVFPREVQLSHRDILGGLMGLGLDREKLGDILILPGKCQVLALTECIPILLSQWDSAGRAKLKVRQIPLCELEIQPPQVKEIRDTVATLRLDAVLAAGFSLSRGKAAELIAAGRAAVNHRECTKVDKTVEKGDVITCRGLGKCVVKDVPGQSRKGRTMVVMERYI